MLSGRVGVVFCGRQSPGGHNVIWGLHSALKSHNPKGTLLGFVGGTEGLFVKKTLDITNDILSTYKSSGGYDLLGRTKDQIRTSEQVNAVMSTCQELKLDGLVIIGGIPSNTDAAQLAETFAELKCPTKFVPRVVGVPVTLNGDLKNQFVEINVGFDTICKIETEKLPVQLVESEMYKRSVRSIVKPGCSQDVLKAALSAIYGFRD
nr:PREDICTED: pyrophosphate--fructose 6-phosphate 1-phosphotransferase subunit alpha-like [Musa acuminata subsp. malaccensis]